MRGRNLFFGAAAAVCAAVAMTGTAVAASGVAPANVRGAADQGAAGASPMSIVIALSPRDSHGLDALLAAQSAGRAGTITPARFDASFAPSAATVRAVATWARSHGLRVASVSANAELVRVSSTAAALGAALGTRI